MSILTALITVASQTAKQTDSQSKGGKMRTAMIVSMLCTAVHCATASVVINEINYNSDSAFDVEDWVELHNPGAIAANMGDWQLRDEDDGHIFTFPQGTILLPDQYLVVCVDPALFESGYGNMIPVLGPMGYGLGGGGDQVRLFSADDLVNPVDFVEYDDHLPWPEEPDGDGATLELLDPMLDNSIPESWQGSCTIGGTPGAMNSRCGSAATEDVPAQFVLHPAFPNPFNPSTTIRFELATTSLTRVALYSMSGRRVRVISDGLLSSGEHSFQVDGSDLSSGVYLLGLESAGEMTTQKLVLLK
ncbi:MAG: lamin tail domain-containing protein [Candidatus Cloacimonetes bacterium]|nr:lamin tail domain-containing protein [Candidatus Cloacimonadota bacterium]